MSPRQNQHHIPRSLLAGFSFRHTEKEHYIHVFRRVGAPFEVATRNFGSGVDFYGADVEERLGDVDRDIATVLEGVRSTGAIADTDAVCSMVANLTVRSRYLRDGFQDGWGAIVNAASETLDDPVAERLLSTVPERGDAAELIQEVFDDFCRTRGVPPQTLTADQIDVAREYLRTNAHVIAPQVVPMLQGALASSGAMKALRAAAASGQRRALLGELAPPVRVAAYRALAWRVETFTAHSLILGDVVAIARYSCATDYSALLAGLENLSEAYLPVSHRHLLVGTADPSASTRVDVERLNEQTAQLSREYLVASQTTAREAQYAKRLGERCGLPGVDEAVREMKQKLRG